MKEIQVTEIGGTNLLYVVTDQNLDATYYSKTNLTVEAVDGYVVIENSGVVVLKELPSDFVNPVESSVVDLVEIIQGYINNLLPAGETKNLEEDLSSFYLKTISDNIIELNEKIDAYDNLNTEDSILGNLITESVKDLLPKQTKSTHVSGAAATHIIKIGRGYLKRIIINAPTNNLITLYDSTKASRSIIAIINPSTKTDPFELDYELDFFSGLVVVTAGTPDLTVITEI